MSVRRTCIATQDPAPCCALVLREAAEAAEEEEAVSEEAEVSGAEAEDSMLALTWLGLGLGLGPGFGIANPNPNPNPNPTPTLTPTMLALTSSRSCRISRLGRKRKADSCARYLVGTQSHSKYRGRRTAAPGTW